MNPFASRLSRLSQRIAALECSPGAVAVPGQQAPVTIATVQGLQTALDGKQPAGSYAPASHNHDEAYQPIGSYVTTTNFTWANLSGKPSTFTPAAHSHPISDVTGLQGALDGKQAAGSYALANHNHDAAYAAIGHNHAGVYQPVGNYLTQFGYAAGSGGTVTQATSKATAVTLNKACGQITMNAAALAANTSVSFTLTNSTIAVSDNVLVNIASGATTNTYLVGVDQVAAGSCRIHLRNISAASKSEALVLVFTVLKGATT